MTYIEVHIEFYSDLKLHIIFLFNFNKNQFKKFSK